jgi:hypothetical protein
MTAVAPGGLAPSHLPRASRAAHVLERPPGRRALIEPPEEDAGPVRERSVLNAVSIFASRRGSLPRPADPAAQRWYRSREVDPDSPDDVASLALLRWWSRATNANLDPDGFPAFHAQFAQWWIAHPECRLAVLVEEVRADAHEVPVPVAMGWVIPCPVVPRAGGPGHVQTPAISDGVFVLPGVPHVRIRRDLGAALGRLAASRGLCLTSVPSRV